MNRKSFFATIAGLFTLPFIAKSKGLTKGRVGDTDWKNAYRWGNNASVGYNSERQIESLIKAQKVNELPEKCRSNTFYAVKVEGGCKLYLTDKEGNPVQVIS